MRPVHCPKGSTCHQDECAGLPPQAGSLADGQRKPSPPPRPSSPRVVNARYGSGANEGEGEFKEGGGEDDHEWVDEENESGCGCSDDWGTESGEDGDEWVWEDEAGSEYAMEDEHEGEDGSRRSREWENDSDASSREWYSMTREQTTLSG